MLHTRPICSRLKTGTGPIRASRRAFRPSGCAIISSGRQLAGLTMCSGIGISFVRVSGWKLMKITEALFAEHQVFHNIFDHLERVVPRAKTLAEIKSLAGLMECMMKAHSDTEDELFIRPLEHCFEQIGQRETFHQEHDEVERTLA